MGHWGGVTRSSLETFVMKVEQRGYVRHVRELIQLIFFFEEEIKLKTKPFTISKSLVMEAYRLVKANKGSGGIDNETLEMFDENLKNNLYKIWNRLSSGTYFPPAVRAVEIPKKTTGTRILGIPTISDRIAQMVIKLKFEPLVEKYFHQDSYGYRSGKSALDAIGITRKRCWKFDWVLEFDIKGLFDSINHELLLRAVKKHTECRFTILYIKRWLKSQIKYGDGTLQRRECGTPQGGVISPVLANLFMHYVFDKWLTVHFPRTKWARYADDGILHCKTLQEANLLMKILKERFKSCGLEMHPSKTQVVYCKDDNRRGKYRNTKFDFLGYTFRPRSAKNKYGRLFASFQPGVSNTALKNMRGIIRSSRLRNRTELDLINISKIFNPILRGWYNYYGKYYLTGLAPLWRHFNFTLVSWAMRKFKKLKGKTRAMNFLKRVVKENPSLFIHWKNGIVGSFA